MISADGPGAIEFTGYYGQADVADPEDPRDFPAPIQEVVWNDVQFGKIKGTAKDIWKSDGLFEDRVDKETGIGNREALRILWRSANSSGCASRAG